MLYVRCQYCQYYGHVSTFLRKSVLKITILICPVCHKEFLFKFDI